MIRIKKCSSTYISKVSIQQLYVSVQNLEGQQLVILLIQSHTEIQAGVPEVQRINVTCLQQQGSK